ncbi:MAG: hypothetical protein IJ140_09060 [Prevotella sp.]|nr:hypothetical protein [Prevotella sp.]
MKKLFNHYFVLAISALLFVGCSNTNEDFSDSNQESDRIVKSKITVADFSAFSTLSYNALGPHKAPGAMNFTEEDAKQLMEPFIEDGKYIKQQLIADVQKFPDEYTSDEKEALMSTTEADMAIVSFALYQMRLAQTETTPDILDLISITDDEYKTTTDYTPDYDLNKDNLQIPWKKFIGCLYYVGFGKGAINSIKNGVKGLITAKALIHIIKSTAVRYFGYIGAAIAVCNFLDCMDWADIRIEERLQEITGIDFKFGN